MYKNILHVYCTDIWSYLTYYVCVYGCICVFYTYICMYVFTYHMYTQHMVQRSIQNVGGFWGGGLNFGSHYVTLAALTHPVAQPGFKLTELYLPLPLPLPPVLELKVYTIMSSLLFPF